MPHAREMRTAPTVLFAAHLFMLSHSLDHGFCRFCYRLWIFFLLPKLIFVWIWWFSTCQPAPIVSDQTLNFECRKKHHFCFFFFSRPSNPTQRKKNEIRTCQAYICYGALHRITLLCWFCTGQKYPLSHMCIVNTFLRIHFTIIIQQFTAKIRDGEQKTVDRECHYVLFDSINFVTIRFWVIACGYLFVAAFFSLRFSS